MAIANLTTAIGFGTLALSSVPVLHAVGVTVGPGAVLALLLSAAFVPRETPP
jgi:predicted exporter